MPRISQFSSALPRTSRKRCALRRAAPIPRQMSCTRTFIRTSMPSAAHRNCPRQFGGVERLGWCTGQRNTRGGPFMPKISMRDALRDALHEEMARDETIIVLGEDVIAHGGPYAVTRGIYEKYPERIRQTPISEAGIVGTALGAALCGMRPVAEIMYVDFITCAMDEVVNQMAKVRYMFGGQTDVPVVLRLPSGTARLIAAQHSQSLEAWFMHVRGLQVAIPSTPYDGKGLLKTALRGRDPVMFIEYKRLYTSEGEVPEGDYTTPFGKADVKRAGQDVTIVATGPMVGKALE